MLVPPRPPIRAPRPSPWPYRTKFGWRELLLHTLYPIACGLGLAYLLYLVVST